MSSVMKYINRIARCYALFRNGKLKIKGLNVYQHSYILKICQNPGVSQDQLSRLLYIHKSNVTRQLALLEQNGYIKRIQNDKDRRILQVYPTEKAYEAYPKIKSASAEWGELLLSDFSEQDIDFLFGMLEKMTEKAVQIAEKEIEKDQGSCEK
ncbi:MAG: Transcriptional repressor MprA [Firmicutes bacterium ADurb.Bin182]|nr:MAG: Transcriptional repressor MprA [Firmicutes bacterium ADurb.Bin182]